MPRDLDHEVQTPDGMQGDPVTAVLDLRFDERAAWLAEVDPDWQEYVSEDMFGDWLRLSEAAFEMAVEWLVQRGEP